MQPHLSAQMAVSISNPAYGATWNMAATRKKPADRQPLLLSGGTLPIALGVCMGKLSSTSESRHDS
jgi:hypothetical protein